MIKLALKSLILIAVTFAICATAYGQDRDQQHMPVGEAKFYPSVRLEFVTNDNVLRAPDATSTSGVVVRPKALFVADRRGLDVQFGYIGGYGAYDESSVNFADHRIFGDARAVFGVRKRGSLNIFVARGHEPLGSGLTRGRAAIGDEPLVYLDSVINGSFTYGAPTARFNVSSGFQLTNHSFQNRTDVSEGRSYTEVAPFAQLSYRLSVDTRALLQMKYRNLSFENSSRDRDELQILAGLAFRGSGKLRGEARLGIAIPDYVDSSRDDKSILTIDASMTYQPSSLSQFDLRLKRQLDNGSSLNQLVDTGQIIDDAISLSWEKEWSGFLSSIASIATELEAGGCPVDSSVAFKAGLDIGLKVKRWITFGLGVVSTSYTESQCDSGAVSEDDYDLVELKAFVTMSL